MQTLSQQAFLDKFKNHDRFHIIMVSKNDDKFKYIFKFSISKDGNVFWVSLYSEKDEVFDFIGRIANRTFYPKQGFENDPEIRGLKFILDKCNKEKISETTLIKNVNCCKKCQLPKDVNIDGYCDICKFPNYRGYLSTGWKSY